MRSETETLTLHGLVTGLIGYFAVTVFYAILNLIGGHSIFYTAAQLGTALFEGAAKTPDVAIWPIATFNMVHLLFFLALGLLGVFIVAETERHPEFWFLAFLGAVVVGGAVMMGVFFFAAPVIGRPWWEVVLPSVVATALMAWYLLAQHPHLRQEMRDVMKSDQFV